jgi:hypothetical protein
MLGVYDFCGHYEWTFEWLNKKGGHALVRQYWHEAIQRDSQQHAEELILSKGIEGMKEYWGHSLDHESAGYHISATKDTFRIDMHDCPSKGFLIRNNLEQYRDYCDHCMGWIGPLMKRAGFIIDHQHDHRGKCWWQVRHIHDKHQVSNPGTLAGKKDVRLCSDWQTDDPQADTYHRSTDPDDKINPKTAE